MRRNDVNEAIDTSNLRPLSAMDDYKVSSNDPDVRGWDVMASDGKKIGEVDDLLVDASARRVAYLSVNVDRRLLSGGGHSGHVMIPVEDVRLDRQNVYIDSVASTGLSSLHSFDAGSFSRSEGFSGGMGRERAEVHETGGTGNIRGTVNDPKRR